jgi:hypothetical protein
LKGKGACLICPAVMKLFLNIYRGDIAMVRTQQLRSFAPRDSIALPAQSIQINIHALQANIILQKESEHSPTV